LGLFAVKILSLLINY